MLRPENALLFIAYPYPTQMVGSSPKIGKAAGGASCYQRRLPEPGKFLAARASLAEPVIAVSDVRQTGGAGDHNLTLTVGVMLFFEGTHVDWGLLMAASVLMTLPMAILFMAMQRHLVAGFGAGAVKS